MGLSLLLPEPSAIGVTSPGSTAFSGSYPPAPSSRLISACSSASSFVFSACSVSLFFAFFSSSSSFFMTSRFSVCRS